jgi:HAMP domain-containing protein
MGAYTLRQKYRLGIVVIIVVSVILFSSVRYLGKGARFQFLEREHYVLVNQMETKIHALANGARGADALTREYLYERIAKADRLAQTPQIELNEAERQVFRLLGFGFVMDLPERDRKDLARLKAVIEAEPGTGFTAEFLTKLDPYLDAVVANSNEFGPTMAQGVDSMKLIFLVLALISIAVLIATVLLLRRNTLPPLQYALEVVNTIRSGDLTKRIDATTRDEMGQLLTGLKEMQETIARLTGQVRSHSEYVFDSTRQMVSGNQDLSSRTEHQASTVEEASATVEKKPSKLRRLFCLQRLVTPAARFPLLGRDAECLHRCDVNVTARIYREILALLIRLHRAEGFRRHHAVGATRIEARAFQRLLNFR